MNKILNYLIGAKKINDKLGVLKHLAVKYPWAGYLDVGLGMASLIPELYFENMIHDICAPIGNEKLFKFEISTKENTTITVPLQRAFKMLIEDSDSEISQLKNNHDEYGIVTRQGSIFMKYVIRKSLWQTDILFKVNDLNHFKNEILKLTHKNYGPNVVIDFGTGNLSKNIDKIYENQVADSIIKEITNNDNISFLFYGPPGTGKTNLTNYIGQKSNLGTVKIKNLKRFCVEDTDIILDRLAGFKIILIDDIDHMEINFYDLLFQQISDMKNSGKIVIATANELKNFPAALIRPGRFDKVIRIDHLDESVVRTMVNGDEELFELVKLQPAACITEFMKRVRVFGKEVALTEKDEIFERAKLILEQ